MKTINVKVLADNLQESQVETVVATCNDHSVTMHIEDAGNNSKKGSCHHSDIGIYVLEGLLTVECSGGVSHIESGAFSTIPKGEVFQTTAKEKTRYLIYMRENCTFTEESFTDSNFIATTQNIVDKASAKDTDHCNFVVGYINDHEVRLGIHKGDYAEHHHSNSDECFLFLEGKYFLAHMLGEEELQSFDFVSVDKLEAHKPYMPKRTYLLYFHKKGIKTVSYAGSDINFFTDV